MSNQRTSKKNIFYSCRLISAFICVGIGAGLGGLCLSELLHLLQHLAFGYGLDPSAPHQSFYQGVVQAPAWRRVASLFVCGLLAGTGWWAIFRFGRKLVSIPGAVKNPPHTMPGPETLAHLLLQIVTVALGSPLGREVAPREFGSLIAGRVALFFGLNEKDAPILVACGAGAGLAAVYNVPIGGAIFTLEVLLTSFRKEQLFPAMLTALVASMVAWAGLGNAHQYVSLPVNLSWSFLLWATLIGPIVGVAAYLFARTTAWAQAHVIRDWRCIPLMVCNFTLIGFAAIWFPDLLGNGKGPIQEMLFDHMSLAYAAALLMLRYAVTWSTLKVGAFGGVLTPGLLHGALIGVLAGGVWNLFFPYVPVSHLAMAGAAAFLASSMRMPFTAVILVWELTVTGHDSLYPMLLCTLGSVFVSNLLRARESGPAA